MDEQQKDIQELVEILRSLIPGCWTLEDLDAVDD